MADKMKVGLLILLSLAICMGARNYRRPQYCESDHKLYMPHEVLDTLEVPDQGTCEELCDNSDECQGFNYETKSTRTCELSETTPDPFGLDMANGEGFTYYEKVENGQIDAGSCSNFHGEQQMEVIGLTLESEHITQRGGGTGWWGKDPLDEQDRVYYSSDWSNIAHVYEFETEEKFVANQALKTHTVKEMYMDGCQHAVYGRRLYYKPYNRRQIMVYDFDTEDTHGKITDLSAIGNTYAGYTDSCHYDWGGRTDLDMATDESGLWIIWGRQNDGCFTSISKVDPENLVLTRTWHLEFDKNPMGNGFIAHGIFYGTDHYNTANDYFIHIHNMRNNSYHPTRNTYPATLRFPNKNNGNYYMNYNPKDKKLYTWENGRQRRYLITWRGVP